MGTSPKKVLAEDKKMAKKKQRISCMHDETMCLGSHCPFHNPSNHHMNKWPMTVRYDRGAMTERICEHGVGHPDPDSLAWLKSRGIKDTGTHGCDGCCQVKCIINDTNKEEKPMKDITLNNKRMSVSATFEEHASLSDVLEIVDGLIRAFGYNPEGKLMFVTDEDEK